MRGTGESCFTAYISHTSVDFHGEENGPMKDRARGLLVVVGKGGVLCVNCMSIRMCSQKSETEGGYLETRRSKFIIVIAFSGIHFPVVC